MIRLKSQNNRKVTDYFDLYKKIERNTHGNLPVGKNIKIALLSSFTSKGIGEILSVKCREVGVAVDFYSGEYNQYAQEILNKDSLLYKFDPDLIIIFIDTRTILGEDYFLPHRISDEQRQVLIDEKLKEVQSLIMVAEERSSAKILFHNFEIPLYSSLGITENKQTFGFIESVEALNINLRNSFKGDSRVFIFDYNSFCSKIGKKDIVDYKMYYMADMRLNLHHMPELCDEYLSYIKPLVSISKKCLVLDLDNTLWGGIIGEDGMDGIKLGPTPEGRPFMELQKYLLSLFHRGVILAINSKNNFDDAMRVLREQPHMILKEEHFSSLQINWNDKISNMKAIAEDIDIGLESMVFVDDDKLNREMISIALPEVCVVDLPEDPSLYLEAIMKLNDFNTFKITDEDRKKGQMYVEQRKRKDFQRSTTDITEYLRGLELVITIEMPDTFNIPRISQLTQKTNQFNLTTKRYLEEDIKKFAISDKFLTVAIRVEDRFGDYGIVGIALVKKDTDKWMIDTFLLSCRVIGRKVEDALLAYILELAKKDNIKIVIGEFFPTKKNTPAKDFYKNNGFKLTKYYDGGEVWEFDLSKKYKYPDFIKINFA